MDMIEKIYYPSLKNYIEANKDRRTKEVKRYVKIAKKMIKYYEKYKYSLNLEKDHQTNN